MVNGLTFNPTFLASYCKPPMVKHLDIDALLSYSLRRGCRRFDHANDGSNALTRSSWAGRPRRRNDRAGGRRSPNVSPRYAISPGGTTRSADVTAARNFSNKPMKVAGYSTVTR